MKLNSGTYGCVYKSELITCSNDPPAPKDKYIAKVVEMKYSIIEFEIGQEIKDKIPCYEYFYAPMEYKCAVETRTLDENLINECNAVKDIKNLDEIGIGKIRNIHRPDNPDKIYTLEQIVEKWLNDPEPTSQQLFKIRYLDTFQYLLKSIQRLNNMGIIHNDLKENNILYDVYNECPIIIDFGISMKTEFIKDNPLGNQKLNFFGSNFFTTLFESILLGKLKKSNTTKTTTQNTLLIDRELLKEWLYEFMNDEDEFQNVFKHGAFNEEQQTIFAKNYERKIEEWIPEDKPAYPEILFKTIFEEIKNKIDIYALGITHLYLCLNNPKLKDIEWTLETEEPKKTIPFFDQPIFNGAFQEVFSPYYSITTP